MRGASSFAHNSLPRAARLHLSRAQVVVQRMPWYAQYALPTLVSSLRCPEIDDAIQLTELASDSVGGNGQNVGDLFRGEVFKGDCCCGAHVVIMKMNGLEPNTDFSGTFGWKLLRGSQTEIPRQLRGVFLLSYRCFSSCSRSVDGLGLLA